MLILNLHFGERKLNIFDTWVLNYKLSAIRGRVKNYFSASPFHIM